jgi:hypothetical protein
MNVMHFLRCTSRLNDRNGNAILAVVQSCAGTVPKQCVGALKRMFASGGDEMDWLGTFMNYEQKGVPKNAGVDCEEGFSLVWLL